MDLSANIAKKILQLLQGETIPYGQLRSKVIDKMIDNGILHIKLQGRSRKIVFVTKPEAIINFLSNQLGINDLNVYIENLENCIAKLEAFQRSVNEALNTGDGTYRP